MSKTTGSPENTTEINADLLMECNCAWNGQRYEHYPEGKPQLSLVRLSIPAHTSLPWHTHPMPNIAYLLSGELTVEDKESGESHTFRAGEAINESVNSAHRGYTSDKPAELIITYAGVEGEALTNPLPGEPSEF